MYKQLDSTLVRENKAKTTSEQGCGHMQISIFLGDCGVKGRDVQLGSTVFEDFETPSGAFWTTFLQNNTKTLWNTKGFPACPKSLLLRARYRYPLRLHEETRHVAEYAMFRLRPDILSGRQHQQKELQAQLRRDREGGATPATISKKSPPCLIRAHLT